MENFVRSIWMNSISQKAFITAFEKINKIPNKAFKFGESVIIEVSDSNWNMLFKFVNHAGNKDWSLESIDMHNKVIFLSTPMTKIIKI